MRSADEVLGSVEGKRPDILVVRTSGVANHCREVSVEVIGGVMAGGLGPEWVDVDLAFGVEAVPSIGIDDDAGFDLRDVRRNLAVKP